MTLRCAILTIAATALTVFGPLGALAAHAQVIGGSSVNYLCKYNDKTVPGSNLVIEVYLQGLSSTNVGFIMCNTVPVKNLRQCLEPLDSNGRIIADIMDVQANASIYTIDGTMNQLNGQKEKTHAVFDISKSSLALTSSGAVLDFSCARI